MTKRHFLGTVAALGLMANGATAQQIINLEEVTFSANLTETELSRAGASVTVLTREQIQASGTTQLSDLLSTLPGVSIIQSGGAGASTDIRLRGAQNRDLAVYIDGIRIDDPSGVTVSADLGQISLYDVERVELLRGSQSAIYGGSAMAGVLNISTRAAQEDGLSQSAFMEGGSYGSVAGGYSLTYRDERVETALSFSHHRVSGFSAFEGIPGSAAYAPGAEKDGYRATRLSFSSRYQVNDVLSLDAAMFYQDAKSEYDAFDPGQFVVQPNSQASVDWRQLGARLGAELQLGTVVHTFGLTGFRIDRDITEFNAPAGFFEGRRLGFEYLGSADVSPALSVSWGVDATRESATSASIPNGRSSNVIGLFGQASWRPNDDLDLTMNVRADRHSVFGTYVSGRVAASYQFSDSITLRAAAARGFRAPSLDELYGNYPTQQFVGNPNLAPETSESAEIGVDYRGSSGLNLSATAFLLNTDNRITYIPCALFDPITFACIGGTLNTVENRPGVSRRHGVELAASVPITDTMTLSGNYTYTDAIDPAGQQLSRVARHTANVALAGQFNDRASYSIGVNHVAGRPPQFGTAWQDYTVANLSMRYSVTDHADLYLRIDNLFDADFQVNPGYQTSGRAFYLGLAARF